MEDLDCISILHFLFDLFARYSYVRSHFIKCIIVPLVKCKTGDLSDVNSYRAISVSTAISKLFEFVLAKFVESADAVDAYQFGFTAGHLTSLCTYVFKTYCRLLYRRG
jgi:hypothetical protein